MEFSYWCEKCNCEQLIHFRIGEAPSITKCLQCGSEMKRMFSSPQVVWKAKDKTINVGGTSIDQIRDLKRQKKIKD